MTAYGTCGHELPDPMPGAVALKRDYTVSYETLCPTCLAAAHAERRVLETPEAEEAWLASRRLQGIEQAARGEGAQVHPAFNELSNAEAERLALLAEELGEAVQAVGKVLRHGYDNEHPSRTTTPRENLEIELGDVLAALEMMLWAADLRRYVLLERARHKLETVGEHLHHQPGRAK